MRTGRTPSLNSPRAACQRTTTRLADLADMAVGNGPQPLGMSDQVRRSTVVEGEAGLRLRVVLVLHQCLAGRGGKPTTTVDSHCHRRSGAAQRATTPIRWVLRRRVTGWRPCRNWDRASRPGPSPRPRQYRRSRRDGSRNRTREGGSGVHSEQWRDRSVRHPLENSAIGTLSTGNFGEAVLGVVHRCADRGDLNRSASYARSSEW